MINEIVIQPAAGLYYAYSSVLAFAKAIIVSVEGTVFNKMNIEGNLAYRYDAATGKVFFNNAFDGSQRVLIKFTTPNPIA